MNNDLNMTNLTKQQYNQLLKIEIKSKDCVIRMKQWNPESKTLLNYRKQFKNLSEQLGILCNDGETIRYKCNELNIDASYGYNFGDVLA
jgi:hypothetical protein